MHSFHGRPATHSSARFHNSAWPVEIEVPPAPPARSGPDSYAPPHANTQPLGWRAEPDCAGDAPTETRPMDGISWDSAYAQASHKGGEVNRGLPSPMCISC